MIYLAVAKPKVPGTFLFLRFDNSWLPTLLLGIIFWYDIRDGFGRCLREL